MSLKPVQLKARSIWCAVEIRDLRISVITLHLGRAICKESQSDLSRKLRVSKISGLEQRFTRKQRAIGFALHRPVAGFLVATGVFSLVIAS